MSEASPANSNPPIQSTGQSGGVSTHTPGAGGAGSSGNFKAIAMLIIGLGIGLVAGAFLAPFAENFFGSNNGIEPVKSSGTPVQDERNRPSSPRTVPGGTPAAPATDPILPQNPKIPAGSPAAVPTVPAAAPEIAPASAPAGAPAPAPKN